LKLYIKNQGKKEIQTQSHKFYIGSLKIELRLVYQGNFSLTCTISKGLHNP